MTGRIISLYTGALGLDRSFHWHGFETVAACDSSAYCHHIIGYYLPSIPIYGSDEDVTSDRLRHDGIDPATIAGVIGGPPCQPSSHAGKRLGVADPRWRWPQAVRVVGDIRPHWFVFEQPAGLVSLVMPDGERPFLAILAALAALGYRVGYDRWPARAVGAPHARMRVALIGIREDVADAVCAGWGTDTQRGCLADRTDGGWQETADRPGSRGAHDRIRPLANADGRDASTWSRRDSLARDITPGSIGGASVADAQSPLGRIANGLSRGLAHLWPAGRGRQQHPWEPPRLVTRPPRGSAATLIAEAELEAMGNSVVSQQFEPVAAAMADIERMFVEVMA